PTRVVKISHPKVTRGGTIVKPNDEESLLKAVNQLIEFIRKKELIYGG
ncbi:unnamed protein product, partial [marine sediment metagenome]